MSMNHDIAVRIEGLGKKYMLGETHQFTRNFRETLMTLPHVLGRRALRRARQASRKAATTLPGRRGEVVDHSQPTHAREEFWALKDINLEIKQGEAIGIIGRNGAGKSTLLKVLSRITAPTLGRAEIHGRVGALLEVGTGMHPELTGRENIYLNGAILGMTRQEINRKFDEIVDFAGVEKFLETPLKRYSSGMRVRLGFSVAAHLEPEILIVDEVLSVGDAEFRKKCLGKMDEVTGEGRTVLFVSHNMQAMKNLCHRAVLLENGSIVIDTSAEKAVTHYLTSTRSESINAEIPDEMHLKSNPGLKVSRIELLSPAGYRIDAAISGEPFVLRIHFKIVDPSHAYRIGFVVRDEENTCLSTCVYTQGGLGHFVGRSEKNYCTDVKCFNPFVPGIYSIDVNTKTIAGDYVDSIQGLVFHVEPGPTGFRAPERTGWVTLSPMWSEPEEIAQ